MIFLTIILIIAILFITIELPPLIKEKRFFPSILYLIFMLAGGTLTALYGLGIKLLNPLDGINYLFKPISTWILNLLK